MDTTLAQQRLFNQRIAGEHCQQPEDVVRWMGALQAQAYHESLWAVGARMQAPSVATVEQAISDRKILRTWPMRGTLHMVPAEDARWMLQLSAARMVQGDQRRLAQLALDQATVERAKQLLHDALTGGKRLARPDVMHLFEGAGISTTGQRGYHLLWHCAQTGLICVGPMEGKQQTFVLLDEWVPHSRHYARDEALAVLAGRFFTSRGPATVHDLAWWAGLTKADANVGLRGASSRLIATSNDGQTYWTGTESPDNTAGAAFHAGLLPGFDEYLLGYQDRSALLATAHAPYIVPGNNGIFLPMVIVDGQVAGTWKRVLRKTAVDLQLTLFTPVADVAKQVLAPATRYAAFLGLPLGSVTAQTGGDQPEAASDPVQS